ncbi:MAG TPA: 23S rRNA (guanosine(2251)-2'-O)-methyltransferase RlmB [Bacteroidales bacterium]|nr:23S rRNA (guanosine(2251)-2'-O)-methyltransferase RlmB [Bacteroidales bacterium]
MNQSENFRSLIWGVHPVEEALLARKSFNKILVNKEIRSSTFDNIFKMCRQLHIPIQKVPVQKLNSLTRKKHQGIIGLMSPVFFYKIDQILPTFFETGKHPLVLILDGVTDMRNFGAVIRSAAAFDVDAIIIHEVGGPPVTADTIKTSAGTIFKVKICKERYLKKTVSFLKNSGLQVIAATEKSENVLSSVNFELPTAIIMGAEDKGISSDLLKTVHKTVKIPINKNIDSLNISVAAGIILYEVRRT